mgnify:CR=1 FL=1
MSTSLIIISYHTISIIVSITDLLIGLIVFGMFYITRYFMFTKFGIKPSFKVNKKFWLANKIISVILILSLLIMASDLKQNAMEVSNGFTIQFI